MGTIERRPRRGCWKTLDQSYQHRPQSQKRRGTGRTKPQKPGQRSLWLGRSRERELPGMGTQGWRHHNKQDPDCGGQGGARQPDREELQVEATQLDREDAEAGRLSATKERGPEGQHARALVGIRPRYKGLHQDNCGGNFQLRRRADVQHQADGEAGGGDDPVHHQEV